MSDLELPCLNCQKMVGGSDALIFEGVYCCPSCHAVASRALTRLEAELRSLLVLARESIRVSLIERRLHLPDKPEEDISKTDLLQAIVELQQKRSQRKL